MTDNEIVLGLIHNNKNAFNELINNYTVPLLNNIKKRYYHFIILLI